MSSKWPCATAVRMVGSAAPHVVQLGHTNLFGRGHSSAGQALAHSAHRSAAGGTFRPVVSCSACRPAANGACMPTRYGACRSAADGACLASRHGAHGPVAAMVPCVLVAHTRNFLSKHHGVARAWLRAPWPHALCKCAASKTEALAESMTVAKGLLLLTIQ
jgi:hypothetical protein